MAVADIFIYASLLSPRGVPTFRSMCQEVNTARPAGPSAAPAGDRLPHHAGPRPALRSSDAQTKVRARVGSPDLGSVRKDSGLEPRGLQQLRVR